MSRMTRRYPLPPLSDQIRGAILDAPMSRYRLGVEADVPHETISRFVNRQRGMSLETLDRIAKVLCLRIVADYEA